MDRLIQDVRYGLRSFARQPAFTLTALVALALGIGANSAVFSVVYAVLLKPLPYPNPDALVYLHDTYPAVTFASVSAAKYVALREGTRSLEALGAMAPASVTLTGRGEPEQVPASRVSADLFKVMQVPALHGRWLSSQEDLPNAGPVIVLSYGLWQRRFGDNPGIVGEVITVDGQARTVVGVMPQGFTYPGQSQAWIPLGIAQTVAPAGNFLRLAGRMKPGVTLEQVQRDLSSVSDAYNRANNIQRDVKVWHLHEIIVATNRRALLVLQGAVAFVLLVACANVANLLLARSVQRQRELAIRAAMGAGRSRIFRQLLTESVLLSALGGAVGVLLASWLVRLFVGIAPASFPRVQAIEIDLRVLAFTVSVAVVTGILFGLAPARRGFCTDPNDSLRDTGARGATSGGSRGASRLLVIAEVAMALMLVIGAGLMVKSLMKLQREHTGFQSDGLMTFELNLPASRYPDASPAAFVERVLEELRAVPGVQAAGAISYLPLSNFGFNGAFSIEGRPAFPRDTAPVVEFRMVTPGYFATMGIPFRRGQDFTTSDNTGGRPVVIVNQAMADRYWPNQNPIGARLQLALDSGSLSREVVGVVGDVRSWRMNTAPVPETFVPHAQVPINTMGFAVRLGEMNPALVMPAIRERIAAADAALPLVRVRPMNTIVDASTGETRMSSLLTSVFALVAALLASVGIYSLIAYSVAQRTREIGIRVALGADRRAVLRLIVGEGLTLASIGLVVGVGGALVLTRTLETMLYEVSPTDPGVLVLTCMGVLLVATLASLVPSIRALRVDPAIALRAE
jgi:putative ABC transport system permease protein